MQGALSGKRTSKVGIHIASHIRFASGDAFESHEKDQGIRYILTFPEIGLSCDVHTACEPSDFAAVSPRR